MKDIIASLNRSRPLIICDADEVLLKFVEALERWLPDNGYTVDFATFSLTDSIRHANTGKALERAEMGPILDRFFAACVEDIEPVPHAAESLQQLSADASVIILSNVPAAQRERREKALERQGFGWPVIANKGSKGPAIAALTDGHMAPVVFVDDLPPHHADVAAAVPHVHRLHFVADQRLARMIPAAPHAHARIDCWLEARDWIADKLAGNP